MFGGFAIGYPNHWMRIVTPAFNSVVLAALVTMSIRDVTCHRKPSKPIIAAIWLGLHVENSAFVSQKSCEYNSYLYFDCCGNDDT